MKLYNIYDCRITDTLSGNRRHVKKGKTATSLVRAIARCKKLPALSYVPNVNSRVVEYYNPPEYVPEAARKKDQISNEILKTG